MTNRLSLPLLHANLLRAARNGVSRETLMSWLPRVVQEEEDGSGSFMGRGIEYDAQANVIRLTGVISDDEWAAYFRGQGVASPGMLRDALALAKDGYSLHINSPGGSVFDATEMITMLRVQRPAETVVTGLAASAAALIMLVGESRTAGSEMAMLMFHAPMTFGGGNATDMQEVVDVLRKVESTMADFVTASVTPEGAADIVAAINSGKDKFYTPAEAVALGILTGLSSDAGVDDPEPEPEPETEPASDPEEDAVAAAVGWKELVARIKAMKGLPKPDPLTAAIDPVDNELLKEQRLHVQRTKSILGG